MKRLLFVFLLDMLCFHSIYSQETSKSLDDYIKVGAAWVDVRLPMGNGVRGVYTPGESYQCMMTYITGDTIIGDETYIKGNTRHWVSSYSYDFQEIEDCWILKVDSLNRLWDYYQQKDELLLGFSRSFEVGDTIIGPYGYLKDVILDVDTITLLDGSKELMSHCKNFDYIYGIGYTLCSFFSPFDDAIEDGKKWNFLCYIRDGEFLYVTEHLKEMLEDDSFVERIMKSFTKEETDNVHLPTFTTTSDEAPIYDLTGRRLDKVPEKGIYIQGGKKRVVK